MLNVKYFEKEIVALCIYMCAYMRVMLLGMSE